MTGPHLPQPAAGSIEHSTVLTSPEAAPSLQVRRARVAVAVLFLTNGAIFANLLPRYPAIKSDLGLTNAQFGAAVAAFPLGALLAGLAAGVLIRRFGSTRTAIACTVLAGIGILIAGVAPSGAALAAGLLLAGAMDALTDVAQNAQGLRVQKLYRRSILNSFHAVWSVGAVAGGSLGALAAGMGLSRGLHLGLSALVFGLLALSVRGYLLPEDDYPIETAEEGNPPARPARRPAPLATWVALAALTVIAGAGAVVEDAGSSWSAIYLSGELGASALLAGAGFVALQGMQFLGRLVGDRLVDRFGQRLIARAGGVLVFVGTGAALLVPTVIGTVVGFGIAGFGVATLVPAAMHGADELPGLRPGTGLTIVSWLLRLGFLVSPPVVGLVADASSLRVGLVIVPLAGLVVIVSSGILTARTRPPASCD